MRQKIFALLFFISSIYQSRAQNRITGPLGMYHIAAGYCYTDSMGTDTLIMQYQFRFGEFAIPNQAVDNGFPFVPQLDSCASWHPNKVFGIIQPPHEHGVYNQPADTQLLAPYPQFSGPGMVQGGQRFSRLSQRYSGFCGVILDDWTRDTAITHQVRDAVQGKTVGADGTVYYESPATTPDNKLYCVIYSANPTPDALPFMDGVVFSVASQNCCYQTMDSDITQVRLNFPHKEIITAIFLNNTLIGGWANAVTVQYLLAHTLDRYDNGDINGITIFAGVYLVKPNISDTIWNGFALPHWLDSLYYPYLGAGQGRVYDCHSGEGLTDVSMRVFCIGRLSGDTMFRCYQLSDSNGLYQCGLWAGNRNTDSTLYYAIAQKSGYLSDTVPFWIKRGATTHIPDIQLCPGILGAKDKLIVYPNPVSGKCHIVLCDGDPTPQPIIVSDRVGHKIALSATKSGFGEIDMTGWTSGLYLIKVGDYIKKIIKN